MTEATIEGHIVTVGDVALDFGLHNQEQAWRFYELLRNNQLTVLMKGKPA